MSDIQLIARFLQSASIPQRNIGLVAEMISTIERLLGMTETDLRSLRWPDKQGRDKELLDNDHIRRILNQRTTYALPQAPGQEKSALLREQLRKTIEREQLVLFLDSFYPTEVAAIIANEIGSLSSLVQLYQQGRLSGHLSTRRLRAEDILPVLEYAVQGTNPETYLQRIAYNREGYTRLVASALYANHLTASYNETQTRAFLTELAPLVTLAEWDHVRPLVEKAMTRFNPKNSAAALLIAQRSYTIFTGLLPAEQQVIFVLTNAIKKVLTESVPKYITTALKTTHPFLVRPLFRSYPDAMVYAVGGKVASSLETIWGSVGEELFLALGGSLRSVRNGGVDVVMGRDAYDIKSGPAVMNNDQINVLRIKQRAIKDDRRVPSLDNFRVALVYGRETDMFGTMAPDLKQGNILAARDAWRKLTEDELAPERVYALSGLLADMIGVPSVVEAASVSEPSSSPDLESNPAVYDDEFAMLFENAYDPPQAQPVFSLERIKAIKQINAFVRDMLN